MSKFGNVVVNGGNNQLGDHGTQHNVTNNNHHHHHSGGGNSGDGDNGWPGILLVVAAVAGLIWWYFGHIDQVYYVLIYFSASSIGWSACAWVILTIKNEIVGMDSARFIGSIGLALLLLGISIVARNHAPAEIIEFSRDTKIIDFWKGLTEEGRNVAVFNFIAGLSIGVAALVAHFGSFRQLAYAAASSTRRGVWYSIYSSTELFKMRIVLVFSLFLCGFAWAAISGYLPRIYH